MAFRVALFGLAVVAFVAAQPAPPVFKAEVALVEVDTSVHQRGTGNPIGGLHCDDFLLFQDGNVQNLATCAYATAPLDLVVLADVSGSVVQEVRRLSDTAERVLQRTLRNGDRIAVVTFSSRIQLIQSLTTDHTQAIGKLQRALQNVTRLEQSSRLFEAVCYAAALFGTKRQQEVTRRRAVLVLSDDKDSAKKPSEEQTMTAVLEADATVFGILLPSAEPWKARQTTTVNLPIPRLPRVTDRVIGGGTRHYRSIQHIVDESGGEMIITARDREALITALDHVRLRYVLAYYPTRTLRSSQIISIQVKLAEAARVGHPDAIVRHRTKVLVP